MPHLLDVLATMGLDALGNHFAMNIPVFSQLGQVVDNLNMRILSVSIPDKEISTYEITKRGRKMNRPAGVSEQSHEVSFTFRADKYWNCYDALVNWHNFIQNNSTMAMASDSGPEGRGGASEYRHDIEIWSISALDDDGVPNNIWTIKGAYPTTISGVEFSEDNGEPIEVDVTLDSMDIIYPISAS